MQPTVRDVLETPELRAGDPALAAGSAGLDRPVRWVHVSEIPDIARLLKGGELVLTTGLGLDNRSPASLRRYVTDLADADAAGLVLELGPRYPSPPPAMVREADTRGLPFVVLRREIPYVNVTERVHVMIVEAQVLELRASEQIHQTFTRLSVDGASQNEIVARVSRMLDTPVVLESLAHQILALDPGPHDPAEVARDWERISRTLRASARTEWTRGCLVTRVGVRGQAWGRLVAVLPNEPGTRERMTLERAATTIALNRLAERDRESLERQAHRSLLESILQRGPVTPDEVHVRARSLGFPVQRRMFTAAVVLVETEEPTAWVETHEDRRAVVEVVARAARAAGLRALVGALDPRRVVMVASHTRTEPVDRLLDALARTLADEAPERVRLPLSVGSPVESLSDVADSLLEAEQVAEVAVHLPGSRRIARLDDVRLQGLLFLLRDDTRVQAFVERELGGLLAQDAARAAPLLDTVRALLEEGGNKTAAAERCGVSRPLLYRRLRRVERLLGVDLENAESRLSLHVAFRALDAMRAARVPVPGEPGRRP